MVIQFPFFACKVKCKGDAVGVQREGFWTNGSEGFRFVGGITDYPAAGLSPYTLEGELRGSRTEYIHWIQDVPDQKQIVGQYCRYVGEIKRGVNVKQMVGRAYQFAMSAPRGPVYLVGAREAMEEEIQPYHLEKKQWEGVGDATLTADTLNTIAEALLGAKEPLLITGYSGRNHSCVAELVKLADTIPGLQVLDTGGSDICFPADHPASLGLRYGIDDAIKTADVILLADVDIPWIPTLCKPPPTATIYHIDADPIKQQMPVFYLPTVGRWKVDTCTVFKHLHTHITSTPALSSKSASLGPRLQQLEESHSARLSTFKSLAEPSPDGTFNASHVAAAIRAAVPQDTIFAIEAVTSTGYVADQIRPLIPGTWINCGGGGLGWSGGGALGIKLAAGPSRFVCQIVGDGTFLFSVPGSVYWISQRYKLPILTVVLNNRGWNAPKRSLLLVHPEGEGSRASNEDLNISFAPSPDYAGIAKAAAGGRLWAGRARTSVELAGKLREAVQSVLGGVGAVLDAQMEGGEGGYLEQGAETAG